MMESRGSRASPRRGVKVQEVDKSPYKVDNGRLKRYDQRRLIFRRARHDPEFACYGKSFKDEGGRKIRNGVSGYTRLDYALSEASWTIHAALSDSFSWERLSRSRPSLMGDQWYIERCNVEDASEMSRILKRAARFFGADLVGISGLDKRWLYENMRYTLEPVEMPKGVNKAVVIAVEMDGLGIATSPSCPASAATGLGYSRMAFLALTIAEFIRNLGYIAIPAGNDVALSIPIAIDSGLGELGRHVMLITPEYGPRVRLCKVFTDLPLIPDKPVEFGVTEFCKGCNLCAEACPVSAIPRDREPGWEPTCGSSNPGALKWYIDGEKCYKYWHDNGIDCSNCVAACPFNTGPVNASTEEFWRGLGNF
jgi:ferredoxin